MAKRRRAGDRRKIRKHERKKRAEEKHRHLREHDEETNDDISLKTDRTRSKSKRNDLMVIAIAIIFILAVVGIYFVYYEYISPSNEGSGSNTPFTPSPNPNSNPNNIPNFNPSNPNNPIVIIDVKDYGPIVIELYENIVPMTVNNFLEYVRLNFYDNLIFHRVIDGFMIQGGGFDTNLNEKTPINPPIQLEIDNSLKHVDGAVAMARTNDPNSATCQFYICDGAQSHLDGNYAVFGQVVAGMDLVRDISGVETHSEKGFEDVPVKDIIINRINEFEE